MRLGLRHEVTGKGEDQQKLAGGRGGSIGRKKGK